MDSDVLPREVSRGGARVRLQGPQPQQVPEAEDEVQVGVSGLQEPRQDEVPHRQPAEPKQEQILQKKVSVSAEILSVPGQKILQVAHSVPGPRR